ncbi:MAG: hypothetical protein ACK5T0_03840 [Vampirovibrionales bacterium]
MKIYNTPSTTTPQQRQGAHLIGVKTDGLIWRLTKPYVVKPSPAEKKRLDRLCDMAFEPNVLKHSKVHKELQSFIVKLWRGEVTHAYAITNPMKQLVAWVAGVIEEPDFTIKAFGSLVPTQAPFVLGSLVKDLEPSVNFIKGIKYSDARSPENYLNNTYVDPIPLSKFYQKLGFSNATESHGAISVDRDYCAFKLNKLTKLEKRIQFFKEADVQELELLPHGFADGNDYSENENYHSLLEDIAKEKYNA